MVESGATPSILQVAVVLPAHVVRGVGRRDRAEQRELGVLQRFRVVAGRRLHRGERDHLHEVVDDDVAQRADRVVEVPAVLDAEVLGHRDLHARDVVAVPDRLDHRVARSAGRAARRCPSCRGSGRSGRAGTRRCAGGFPLRARARSARSWPKGFSTTTRAVYVSGRRPSRLLDHRAEQERRDLQVEDGLCASPTAGRHALVGGRGR